MSLRNKFSTACLTPLQKGHKLKSLIARGFCDTPTVLSYIESGALLNQTDRDGNTPLMRALTFGHYPVARALMQHGAGLEHKNKSGKDALAISREQGLITFEHMIIHQLKKDAVRQGYAGVAADLIRRSAANSPAPRS